MVGFYTALGSGRTQQDQKGLFWGMPSPVAFPPIAHSLPVLMTFWMTLATWPLSNELSILTRRIRQVHRSTREPASRMSPTARSGSPVFTKM